MPANPWYTSDDIVAAVQRKIAFPLSQNTFSEQDILDFANEEMMIAQVPSVMEYHQEYFTETAMIVLQSNISTYAIPNRAIGNKLRDIFYVDNNNNFVEMTRVNSDDRAFFQANIASSNSVYKFFLQGNAIVVTPAITEEVFGSLMMVYFIRPNQLVPNDQAATITGFQVKITMNNTGLNVGDQVIVTPGLSGITPSSTSFFTNSTPPPLIFTAVSGAPAADQFQIGVDNNTTASNLATAINLDGTYSATVSTNVVTLSYTSNQTSFSTNNLNNSITYSSGVLVVFDNVPTNITNGSKIDVLETDGAHKILAMDIVLGSNAISGNVIQLPAIQVPQAAIASGVPITPSIPTGLSPYNMSVGDYICNNTKCIIPYIPTDIQISLVERTCSRILAAMGDMQGMQVQEAKLQQVEKSQGTLIDNRVEGSPMKVLARHSLARFGKMGPRRNLS